MLNHVYSNRPELYNYTHCAYGRPSYLFYASSVIMSEDATQQGDPEATPLFAETIHTLVKQLESKINICYLDDGNLDIYMLHAYICDDEKRQENEKYSRKTSELT